MIINNYHLFIVDCVWKVVEELLNNDEDMAGLYLTQAPRMVNQHQEIEHLLEAYFQDLTEILAGIDNMKDIG
jgi:adenylate kinase family enzyme